VSPRLRNEQPGAIYHVLARGVDRRRIFVDDEDYQTYTRLLAAVVRRQGWHLLAYCLMPNHVHLLIETPETNLANGMQWLHARYARAFNDRHARRGHLFEAPFKSPRVTTEADLIRVTGYIAANPVKAALCTRAMDWPWSSHALVSRGGAAPVWLAHGRLLGYLESAAGFSCYEDTVAARERECSEHVRRRRQQARASVL
jgi:REP element-mobilizing transposase RayT